MLTASAASAQYRGSPAGRFSPDAPEATSLTVGPLSFTPLYDYPGLERTPFAEQQRSGVGVRLAGETSTLTVGFVPAESVPEGTATALGAAGFVSLAIGPTFRPLTVGEATRVSLLVPVHLGLAYQYLEPRQPASGEEGPDTFHIVRAGLGAGLGLEMNAQLTDAPVSEIGGRTTVVVSPGALTDFSDLPFDPTFGERTAAFDVEARVAGLGGSSLGLAVGYTLEVTRWNPVALGENASLLDSVGADGFVEQSRSSILRVGLLF